MLPNDLASGLMLQRISFPCTVAAGYSTHPLVLPQLEGLTPPVSRQCDRFSLPPHFAPPCLGPCSTASQPQGGRLRPVLCRHWCSLNISLPTLHRGTVAVFTPASRSLALWALTLFGSFLDPCCGIKMPASSAESLLCNNINDGRNWGSFFQIGFRFLWNHVHVAFCGPLVPQTRHHFNWRINQGENCAHWT